jgi:hypothetical protein
MLTASTFRGRVVPTVLFALVVALLPGCNKAVRRVPVSGAVTLDGKPLNVGVVNFYPDPAKGNELRIACQGRARNGQFTLSTTAVRNYDNGPGTPLGWYKVYLDIDVPGGENLKIYPRFTDPNKTPISVEVVENPSPGAYDIKFTSK